MCWKHWLHAQAKYSAYTLACFSSEDHGNPSVLCFDNLPTTNNCLSVALESFVCSEFDPVHPKFLQVCVPSFFNLFFSPVCQAGRRLHPSFLPPAPDQERPQRLLQAHQQSHPGHRAGQVRTLALAHTDTLIYLLKGNTTRKLHKCTHTHTHLFTIHTHLLYVRKHAGTHAHTHAHAHRHTHTHT